jgi:quercetin dioxygenase-like cupin family protein
MNGAACSMLNTESFNLNAVDWAKFEKGNTKGIYVKDLDPTGFIETFTVKLMKVKPGGAFPPHVDPYSHLFYLLKGTGEGLLGENVYRMERGHVTFVKAGVQHGYRNIGADDLYLLTLNIPEDNEK